MNKLEFYENIKNRDFSMISYTEEYSTNKPLITPILLDKYIEIHTTDKVVLLIKRYYGIKVTK